MAQTLKGKGVIWGVGGVTCTAYVGDWQNADFDWTAQSREIPDANGETAAKVFFNAKKTFRVTLIPSAATIAAAKTNADGALLAPGTLVTVVDADSAVTDAGNSGKFIVVSSKLTRAQGQEAVIEAELEQFVADISATISS